MGSGSLLAGGAPGGCGPGGGAGIVRAEGCRVGLSSQNVNTLFLTSTPIKLLLPTSPVPSIQVTSVAGMTINANPFSFPDTTLNTSSPVPVVITAHQVPLGTVPTLNIFSGASDQQLKCPAPGLQGPTVATSTCTINVPFAQGGSQGVVRVTWTP
jgi:hypothetical protein